MNTLPPWLQVQYPFDCHAFDTSAGKLNYIDAGAGTPVVMLHGNPTWSFFYRNLVLALRETNRCLVPDHLGCGLSDKPQVADYSLSAHVERTVAWIESLELDGFHLVVHDWGGAIGFGVADRIRDQIKSISILNTAAFAFPSIPFRISVCRWPLAGKFLVRGLNGFVEAATKMTTVEPLPEGVAEGYRYPYGNWHDRVAIDAFVNDIPMRKSHRSWSTLQAIENSLPWWQDKPVQILWGMQDWCFHTGILNEWEKRLPGAKVYRFAEAGHYLMEDAGEAIYPVIREFVN
ncbi:alpha/beta fold hydrolase [Puniceicoccales bacterium CK1056]|uniref:Alpha/beta fold hydrolase n=1 Tax=Oceanipulchritudo coccoides TaxID=2706888 RepID=A0A6B2M2L3_9BACT|nr:alpha/beta fold hydrolase [Oceanipulchritudo coccoides]NDV62983.1 alpha/beta fold hydrolase [Oceanipulchritudo coccoides]